MIFIQFGLSNMHPLAASAPHIGGLDGGFYQVQIFRHASTVLISASFWGLEGSCMKIDLNYCEYVWKLFYLEIEWKCWIWKWLLLWECWWLAYKVVRPSGELHIIYIEKNEKSRTHQSCTSYRKLTRNYSVKDHDQQPLPAWLFWPQAAKAFGTCSNVLLLVPISVLP